MGVCDRLTVHLPVVLLDVHLAKVWRLSQNDRCQQFLAVRFQLLVKMMSRRLVFNDLLSPDKLRGQDQGGCYLCIR